MREPCCLGLSRMATAAESEHRQRVAGDEYALRGYSAPVPWAGGPRRIQLFVPERRAARKNDISTGLRDRATTSMSDQRREGDYQGPIRMVHRYQHDGE